MPEARRPDTEGGQRRRYDRHIDVVFLCTGNVCRSPMAEALLRHRLDQAGVPATVSSVGVWRAGEAASGGSVRAMGSRGLDLAAHRSRLLSPELLKGADLVLGMAREHVREVAVLAPELFGRSYTLKELVRRGEALGPVSGSLDDWLTAVNRGRRPTDLLGSSDEDDVADPIGQPDTAYERTAVEIERLVDRLVALLVGARTARSI